MKKYDLVVVGGGSGGIAGARRAASYGAKVLVCEKSDLGGTCVNLGCVPKKIFYYAAECASFFEDSKNFGWDIDVKNFSWSTLIKNKNSEIERLNGIYKKLLVDSGVDLVKGKAEFIDKNTISINGENVYGKKILIASGSYPFIPEFPGNEHVVTSDDMFFLKKLPKSIVIVGAGYIGLEFAFIMNALGCNVTVLIRKDVILKGFDDDVIEFVSEELEKKKIHLKQNINIISASKSGDKVVLLTNQGEIKSDIVMYATGRIPNTFGLGLEKAGVLLNARSAIQTTEYSKTNIDNIFAVGDVTGGMGLTPVAINQARAFADTEFGNNKRKMSNENIASAVFSQPGIATVGLSEADAKAKYKKIKIYKTSFKALKNNISKNPSREFMKLVVDEETDKVLGVHLVGKDAAEIIQMAAVALKCGATKKQFDDTVGVHPTAAEELVTMR